MLCTLGLFVFETNTAPLLSLERETKWRYESSARIGLRDAQQYVGPGKQSVKLKGILVPEVTGGAHNIDELHNMADEAKAWTLIDATGKVWGQFFIEQARETYTKPLPTGEARKIEFELGLLRADSKQLDNQVMGDINVQNNRATA